MAAEEPFVSSVKILPARIYTYEGAMQPELLAP